MFASAFALVFTAAASARADKADDVATQLVEAFNQPKCPKLLALYAPNMVKAFGSESARRSFCGGLIATGGRMMRAQRVDAGKFHLVTERGSWRLTFALDESGLITALNVNNFSPPLAFVKKTLRWPLGDTAAPAKETFVVHGGATSDVNHHVDNLRQRRALDLCAADANGKTFRTDGKSNSDYFVYGAPVVAAGDGVVVVVIDGVPENVPGKMNKDMVPGNLVVIDHRNGEWSHYAHLIPGSATKRIGDVVKSGDVLGKVGNSGNSSEPHLHFHVQDSAELLEGVGIDPQFHDVIVNGRQKKAPHPPVRGERIRAALPPNP